MSPEYLAAELKSARARLARVQVDLDFTAIMLRSGWELAEGQERLKRLHVEAANLRAIIGELSK